MSVPSRHTAGSLAELLDDAQLSEEGEPSAELDYRSSPRFMLFLPIHVRTPTGSGLGPAHGYQLTDISNSGLAFTSAHPFEPGHSLLVELCANNTYWSGRVQVAHCTKTLSGYVVGGEAVESLPSHNEPPPDDHAAGRRQRIASLDQLRGEIHQVVRSYRLGRRTWGLLGASAKENIRKVIAALPGLSSENGEEGYRESERMRTRGDVQMVLALNYGWKRLHPRIVDVSEGGVGLRIPLERLDDQVERDLAGEFEISPKMFAILGFGSEPSTLWIPARVVDCVVDTDCMLRVGVQFDTGEALDAFMAT